MNRTHLSVGRDGPLLSARVVLPFQALCVGIGVFGKSSRRIVGVNVFICKMAAHKSGLPWHLRRLIEHEQKASLLSQLRLQLSLLRPSFCFESARPGAQMALMGLL
jgi:hypothetical protein